MNGLTVTLAPSLFGELRALRVYDRYLGTSEAVANYRAEVSPEMTPMKPMMLTGAILTAVGIIALKEGNLQLCYPAMGGEPPTTFATKAGSGLHLFVLKRKQ